MSRIRGRDTSPEKILRSALWARGKRYRVQQKLLSVRPDLIFKREQLAIFVDGCFWHGCPEHYVKPRSRDAFWSEKLLENFERDRRQTIKLEEAGWQVLRFWEHEIFESLEDVVEKIDKALFGSSVGWPNDKRVVRVKQLPGNDDMEERFFESLQGGETSSSIQKRSTKKWARGKR
jgi:DNA mismatch endonuclease (patch repair protein)